MNRKRCIYRKPNHRESGLHAPPKIPRRRRALTYFLGFVALLPAILSPTAPLSVYGYVAARYLPALMPPVYADDRAGLEAFLLAPAQLDRYRSELIADLAEPCSGKLFAIVRAADSALAHAPVRTWHAWLPETTPAPLRTWLDRKEIPWLPDLVRLWRGGQTIVAMGHYHPYGGGPSHGDQLAQKLSDLPEIVVSNGVVPILYLRGALLPYGHEVNITDEVFRSLRTLERSLMMDTGDDSMLATVPSPALYSYLAYLRDYRGADIQTRDAVAAETRALCRAFKASHAGHFPHGYTQFPYAADPDRLSLINNLAALHGWAECFAPPLGGA